MISLFLTNFADAWGEPEELPVPEPPREPVYRNEEHRYKERVENRSINRQEQDVYIQPRENREETMGIHIRTLEIELHDARDIAALLYEEIQRLTSDLEKCTNLHNENQKLLNENARLREAHNSLHAFMLQNNLIKQGIQTM